MDKDQAVRLQALMRDYVNHCQTRDTSAEAATRTWGEIVTLQTKVDNGYYGPESPYGFQVTFDPGPSPTNGTSPTSTTRAKLVEVLKASPKPLTARALAKKLGVSRRRIRQIVAEEHGIESRRGRYGGYRLANGKA